MNPEPAPRDGATGSRPGFSARHLAFVLPAAFAVLVTVLGQWWNASAFDADEGINLGKGALVAAGFHPYAEIWNDQPPVLTYVLAAVQWAFPWSVSAARVAVLLFACLLLYSMFRVVERSAGTAAAATSVILLGTAPLMWRLSISVMIGLPAVALAMAACAIVYRRESAGLVRAAAAGLVFALSLQTKLFTAAALPAFLAAAYLSGDDKTRGERIAMAAAALAAAAAGFALVALVSGEPFLPQLVSPHVDAEVRAGYAILDTTLRLAETLIQQPFVLFAALLAASPRWSGASRLQAAWLIWIGVALVILLGHTPLWYHHALLLLVPMACLGGAPLWRFLEAGWRGRDALARYRAPLAIGLLVVAVAYLTLLLRPFHAGASGTDAGAARLIPYAEKDPWVATDQPFEAFQAGLLVPPELIVFSRKRIEAHNLTPSALVAVIAARRPGQVLLRRAHAGRPVLDWLDRNYVRVDKARVHYARPDLAG